MSSKPIVHVDAADLRALAARALTSRGVLGAHARVQADHLVAAELRGHPSHGLRRLAVLTKRIDNGLIDPVSSPVMEWSAAGALRVDGARGFGPVVAYRAIDALRDRIVDTGIATAALRRTHHLGILAPYVEDLAAAGLVGVVLSSTEGLVHPWGGVGALLGTNPIAIGVPASGGDLIMDMSTGAVSAGKILDYRAKGMPLPDGWAVDAAGYSTNDAAAAAAGAISPFGGPKGYALGLAFGALVASLTGTSLGPDVHGTLDTEHEASKGDVIIAIAPTVLAGSDMRAPLRDYFDVLRGSGVDGSRVTVPGDRARVAKQQSSVDGVAVSADVWAEISALADNTSSTATRGDTTESEHDA